MATGRKITLKNDNDEWLIPKTTASNVVALIGKDDEGNTSFVYQDSVNSTLAQAKMDKGETGKDADGKPIYFNKTGKDLDDSIQKVINGDTPVAKADVAKYLYYSKVDEGKEEKINSEGLIAAAASKAAADVGTTLETSYYTQTQIDEKLKGIGEIGAATRGGAGIVRLATQEEVDSGEVTENIPEGGNPGEPPAVVVTPMTLAKKLEKYATSTEMETAIADKIAEVVADADTDFDTLKEIADWILNDTTGAAAMANDISALKEDVETAETDISNLKTKDTSHDNSITAINNALYGSGDARKFVTLAEFNPVKLNADDVPALVTWKNQVSQRTEIDGEIVSVFAAVADGEGNDIASTYVTKTEKAAKSSFLNTEERWAGDVNAMPNIGANMGYYPVIPSSNTNIPNSNGYQNAILTLGLHETNGAAVQFFFVKSEKSYLYYRGTTTGEWQRIALTRDVDEVRQDVENIKIGGDNLILNSDFSQGTTYWKPLYIASTVVFSVKDNIATLELGASDACLLQTSAIQFEAGQAYTVSFDCKSDEYTALDYCFFIGQEGQGNASLSPSISGISSEWNRIVYTFTSIVNGLYRFGFGANRNQTTAGSFKLRNVKIEKGNKATDWSPSLEDEVAWRKIVGLNYVVTGDSIEY